MLGISGVLRYSIVRCLRGAAHGEFIHIGLAQDHCACLFQIPHSFRAEGRYKVLQNFGRAGGQGSFSAHIVFDGEGNSGQRPDQFACFDLLLYFRCLL